MGLFRINSISYSIADEGSLAGKPFIFVRFAGCNLACSWCDVDLREHEQLSRRDLLARFKKFNCRAILWTGGEPMAQLKSDDFIVFRQFGYYQAIETNGTFPFSEEVFFRPDYIVVSPKPPLYDVNWKIPYDEVRIPLRTGDRVDASFRKNAIIYFSPVFNGKRVDLDNLHYAVEAVKRLTNVRLALPIKKLIRFE